MKNEMTPNDVLRPIAYRPSDTARLLGISLSHLDRMTKAGEIPYAFLRGIRVYSDDALRKWISEKIEETRKKTEENDFLDVRKDDRDSKNSKE